MSSMVREKVLAAFSQAGGVSGSIVVVAVTVGTALRFHGLETESLWLDELFTADRSNPEYGLDRLFNMLRTDVHPPLYMIFMYLWTDLFGQSEYTLRLPSAIFGSISLLFAAYYYRRITNDNTLAIFIILLSFSPGAIFYSQEARSYSLLLLLSVVVTGLSVNMVQQINLPRTGTWRDLIPLFTSGLVASYTHYFGFIITSACFFTVLLYSSRASKHIRIIIAYLFILVLFLPWVVYNYFHKSTAGSWIIFRPMHHIEGMLDLALGKDWTVFLLLVALVIYLAGNSRLRSVSTLVVVPTIIIISSISIAIALSVHTPILTSRNLIILFPSLFLVSAHLLAGLLADRHSRWRPAFASLVLLTVTVVTSVETLKNLVRTERPQYRESAEFITSLPECRTASILVGGPFIPAYEFYTNQARDDVDIDFILARTNAPAMPAKLQDVLTDDCPVVIWSAHGLRLNPELLDMLSGLGVNELVERKFHGATVFLEP